MSLQQMLVAGGVGPTLIQMLTNASLTTNLQLCLDAGDPASYTSGTKWLDRSGNGFDFFLGTDGTTNAPTFTSSGAQGRQSYFTCTSSQLLTYDTTNEAWMNNIHKNNANFTLVYFNYPSTGIPVYGSTSTSTITGTGFGFCSATFSVLNANANVIAKVPDSAGTSNVWHMDALSLNEATGAGGGFFYLDGNYNKVSGSDTFNSTYTSPSAGAASQTMILNSWSGETQGNRIAAVAAWSTSLTKANLDTIWGVMRGRFGI